MYRIFLILHGFLFITTTFYYTVVMYSVSVETLKLMKYLNTFVNISTALVKSFCITL